MFLGACNEEKIPGIEIETPESITNSLERYYSPENQKEHGYEVAQNHAIRIAQNHFDLRSEYFGKQKILKQVKNLEIIRDSISQKPLLYVIQYKSGFCIMSADSREQPILAYSEDNDWSGSSLRGPDIFLKIYGNNIKKIKNKNEKQRVEIGGVWKKLSSVNPKGGAADLIIEPTGCNPDNCNYYSSVATTRFVDALARWGQDFSFNFYSPAKSNCDDCDRIAAGCGPVAVGMLLRYHEFPIMNMSFNGQTAFTDYANMPRFAGGCNNNTGGFRSSAMLIRIAGNVMSSDYGGVFGCETATYPANIGDGLDFFGYSHDGKGKLSDRFFDVQNDLENQFPVIFSGATSPVGNNWHIWLADGFQQTSYEQCHNNVCSYYSYSSWSMNWGQHGDGNGWYSTSPNSIDEYDELLRVYTNIRPN